MLCLWLYTGGCTNTVRESALKAGPRTKIPCLTRESNLAFQSNAPPADLAFQSNAPPATFHPSWCTCGHKAVTGNSHIPPQLVYLWTPICVKAVTGNSHIPPQLVYLWTPICVKAVTGNGHIPPQLVYLWTPVCVKAVTGNGHIPPQLVYLWTPVCVKAVTGNSHIPPLVYLSPVCVKAITGNTLIRTSHSQPWIWKKVIWHQGLLCKCKMIMDNVQSRFVCVCS